jgi:hypothetical protein
VPLCATINVRPPLAAAMPLRLKSPLTSAVAWRPCAGGLRHPRTDIRGLLAAPKKGVNGNGVPMLQPNAANLPMRKECFGLYGDEQLWQIEDLGPPSFMPGSALPLGDNLLLSCARSAA